MIQAYVERSSRPLQDVERHVLKLRGERSVKSRLQDVADHAPASIVAPPLAEKYGFIFGTGVVCGYLSEYYSNGPPNPVIAAKTLLRGVGSAIVGGEMIRRMAEPFRGTVELDDGTIWEERDYLAVAGGTIDQIGLNFRPFHRYGERPGAFHILGIHTSPMGFVSQLPRIWRAHPMSPGHTFEATTTSVTVRSPKSPIRYMVDGDLHECDGPLHVSIGLA